MQEHWDETQKEAGKPAKKKPPKTLGSATGRVNAKSKDIGTKQEDT